MGFGGACINADLIEFLEQRRIFKGIEVMLKLLQKQRIDRLLQGGVGAVRIGCSENSAGKAGWKAAGLGTAAAQVIRQD